MRLKRVLGAVRLAGVEQSADVVELVQDLLEPQLVDLMDHDEQHLVVFRAVGARLLQGQQFVDAQVGVVGDGGIHRLDYRAGSTQAGRIFTAGRCNGDRPRYKSTKKEVEGPQARRAFHL